MTNMMRNLIVVLGDQLDPVSAAFDDANPDVDVVWMAEVDQEITQVLSHKQRILFFLSSMRHFRQELEEKGWTVHYHQLEARVSRKGAAIFPSPREKLNPKMLTRG